MKWHKFPDEIPKCDSGSYLILTVLGDISEAEYNGNEWLQYRWSAIVSKDSVVAWCSFDDIERPKTIE